MHLSKCDLLEAEEALKEEEEANQTRRRSSEEGE
jgi:hypothetical protein